MPRPTSRADCALPGNTPLHLAMDSAHAEAAVLLIEAGADRSRVSETILTVLPNLMLFYDSSTKSKRPQKMYLVSEVQNKGEPRHM